MRDTCWWTATSVEGRGYPGFLRCTQAEVVQVNIGVVRCIGRISLDDAGVTLTETGDDGIDRDVR